jgi:hypothetical protein
MNKKRILDIFVYGMLVVLCLAVLVLMWASMHQFTNTRPVYQGF